MIPVLLTVLIVRNLQQILASVHLVLLMRENVLIICMMAMLSVSMVSVENNEFFLTVSVLTP